MKLVHLTEVRGGRRMAFAANLNEVQCMSKDDDNALTLLRFKDGLLIAVEESITTILARADSA